MTETSTPPSAPGCAAAQQPMISVVIPVRNEQAHLGAVLRQLCDQDYPSERYEILVIDGNSTDKTADIVRAYQRTESPRILLLANPNLLSSAGRNIGIQHSQGEIVIFIDGHCFVPTRSLLSDTAGLFGKTGADCLCRPQPLMGGVKNSLQDAIARARATSLGHGRDSMIYNLEYEGPAEPTSSGATYRRAVFEKIGLYDESFDACEDVEFNYRVFCAGLKSYASPRLAVYYRARATLSSLFKQLFRYGRGRLRLLRKHRDSASLAQLVPAVLVASVLGGSPLAIFFSPVRVLLLALTGAYVGLLLGFAVSLGIGYGWRYLLAEPAIYLTIHFALGIGWWSEAVSSFLRPAGRTRNAIAEAEPNGLNGRRLRHRVAPDGTATAFWRSSRED